MKFSVVAGLLVSFFGFALIPLQASAMTGPPAKAQTSLVVAKTAIDAGEFHKATDELRTVLVKEPENADVWNMLGFSYRRMGEFDMAWDAYERALTINPNHRGANEYLGELYLQQGQMDLAKKQLQKLADLCPFGCRERSTLEKRIQEAQDASES